MNEYQVSSVFWLFALGALAYFAAAAVSLFNLRKTGRSEGPVFMLLGFAGFALQSAAFIMLTLGSGRLPLANSYELMEAVAWALMFANLLGFFFLNVKVAPTLAALTSCALTALPLFCPAFADGMMKAESPAVSYAGLHAVLAILSYAALGFSFVFSLMYIFQKRSLKAKEGGPFSRLLLPLPRLTSFSKFFLCGASALMALSLFVGALAAFGLEMNPAYVIKFTAGSVLFLLMLGLLVFSSKKNFDAAVFAKLNIALFVFAVVLIVPISIRSII